MATKKTSMFTLTERVTLAAGADPSATATIDIGSYVDVGDRQALEVHSVDYIYQGATGLLHINASVPNNGSLLTQLTDLNRGGMVFANDRALISSASLHLDGQGGQDNAADLYPDQFGKGSEAGRFVVNDQLYVSCQADGTLAAAANVTIRVNCSIVSLSAKDFMAIAIQSTAADN